MNNPKPILTTTQKCRECGGIPYRRLHPFEERRTCPFCTRTQPLNIYDLRDFEKCTINKYDKKKELCSVENHLLCKGTSYKIPFKDYEIKKVSEIGFHTLSRDDAFKFNKAIEEHNLKEDDKVVVTSE